MRILNTAFLPLAFPSGIVSTAVRQQNCFPLEQLPTTHNSVKLINLAFNGDMKADRKGVKPGCITSQL